MLEATLNRGAPRTRSRSGRHRSFWTMLSGLGLALALPAGRAGADAVMLVPACIVLDVTTDSATVVVHNRGTSAVTWQLDLVRMGRTAAGRLRPVAPREPSAAAVDSSIVVSPRECLCAASASAAGRSGPP